MKSCLVSFIKITGIVSLMAVMLCFAGCTTAPADTTTITTTVTTYSGPPEPGDWTSSTEFGEMGFTVSSDSTGITKMTFSFVDFLCGGVQFSGDVTSERDTPWPITDGQFTISVYIYPWDMVFQGEFDETGKQASGTWEVTGEDCSGTWESSRA